jgi:hypothetical protein
MIRIKAPMAISQAKIRQGCLEGENIVAGALRDDYQKSIETKYQQTVRRQCLSKSGNRKSAILAGNTISAGMLRDKQAASLAIGNQQVLPETPYQPAC